MFVICFYSQLAQIGRDGIPVRGSVLVFLPGTFYLDYPFILVKYYILISKRKKYAHY